MTEPTFRLVTCNARKELAPAAARETVAKAFAAGDIVVWQEIETAAHHLAILHAHEFATYWPDGDRGSANAIPISWRKDRFTLVYKNRTRILLGIRAVTPDRWTSWVVLRDNKTGLVLAVQNTHLISAAFTGHKERRSKWNRCATQVSRRSVRLIKNRGALVGGGDMNRNKWAPTGTRGAWAAKGTHGAGTFYDSLFLGGKVQLVDEPTRIPTPSDHDALVATLRRTR